MEQETRIAVVGIIVENKDAVGEVNQNPSRLQPLYYRKNGTSI